MTQPIYCLVINLAGSWMGVIDKYGGILHPVCGLYDISKNKNEK